MGSLLSPLCPAQSQPAGSNTITITGKVLVQQRGDKERVVVHAMDAQAYSIEGPLAEQLTQIAREKNDRTVVTLTGTLTGARNLSCEQTRTPEHSNTGETKLKINARCIRYSIMRVTSVDAVFESVQPVPEPLGDEAEEKKLLARARQKSLRETRMGEIYGKIISCDLRSVVKTVTVGNLEKDNPVKSITALITADTRIAEKIGGMEPAAIQPGNLKPGQRVTLVYAQHEKGIDALFITVTGK
jgi:hypothetical protein